MYNWHLNAKYLLKMESRIEVQINSIHTQTQEKYRINAYLI